jgi:two-component system, OmpR family, copper resistance phosphate regulon response regulator CusR
VRGQEQFGLHHLILVLLKVIFQSTPMATQSLVPRILIAEDETRLAAFLEKGLRKSGFETVVAEDGQAALEMAQSDDYALLLLDIGLPLKDGWVVLQELRRHGQLLPVIVVTAFSDDRKRATAMAAGANDYITKPFRFKELLQRIHQQLQ